MSPAQKSLFRVVCIAGLLSLLHCAYSAAQHRFYLRLTEQPFTQLPADLILQTLISLVAVVYSASYIAGDFLPVRSDLQNRSKSWDTVGNCPSFYTFGHRARALSPTYSAFNRDFIQDSPEVRTIRWTRSWGGLVPQEFLSSNHFAKSLYTLFSSLARPICSPTSNMLSLNEVFISRKVSVVLIPYCCCGRVSLFSPLSSSFCFYSTASPPKRVSPFLRPPKVPQTSGSVINRTQFLPNIADGAKNALNHCIDLVKTRDFANYIGALLFPSSAQPAAFALLAFNVELAVIRDQIKRNSGTTGIYRLQFWKDTVDAVYGRINLPVPRQPVATALALFARKSNASFLYELISSRQSTLGDRPFEKLEQVLEYGRRTHGTLMKLLIDELWTVGSNSSNLDDDRYQRCYLAAEKMGAAMGVITLLRAAIPLLARGVVLLPNDLMCQHGLTADQFYNNRNHDGLQLVAADMVKAAEYNLQQARAIRNEVPQSIRIALMANGATLDFLIGILKKSNYNLLDARLQRSCDLLAWRLSWRKLLGRF